MRVDIRPISEIKTAKYNPRKISEQQLESLKASINRFGFVDPVIVNDRTGTLVGGHQRIKAAKALGLTDVPVIGVSLDEAEEKALNVALNKISGEWDLDLLRGVLEDVIAEGLDISLTGFSEDEWSAMSSTPSGTAGLTDPDEVPELPEQAETITQPGDVWVLGRHRVMCGDSTKAEDVARLMGGAKAGLVFSDPPYGVEFRSNMSKRFDVLKNDDKILDIASAVWGAMSDNTAAFIWTSHHVYPAWRSQFEQFYKQTIVWYKGGGGMGDLDGQYALDYELALFCTKGSPKFRGKRGMAVWQVSKDAAASYVHPTQKPVTLAERAISDFSDTGDIVLDLFGGSGSTLIACETNSRKARLMEIDPQYCDVIVKRWENFTGKKAVRE